MEFTSTYIPQHNNLAELAFPCLVGQAISMVVAAHVPDKPPGKVILEALKCATMLNGL